jgi:hypothetical protein
MRSHTERHTSRKSPVPNGSVADKKVFYIGPPHTFREVGKLLPYKLLGAPTEGYNFLTSDIINSALTEIKIIKPDVVMIYNPGISTDDPIQRLLINETMRKLRAIGTQVLFTEYDAPSCAMKPLSDGVTVLIDTQPTTIAKTLDEILGANCMHHK